MKDRLIYFRDAFIPEIEAKVSVLSASSQYGLNVFEGVRGYYNADQNNLFVFRLSEHIERLFRSAGLLDFRLDRSLTPDFIEEKVLELIRLNDFKQDIYIRICLFLDNEMGWSSLEPVSLIINAFPKGRTFGNLDGISCCVSSWKRISDGSFPPRIKAGPNYLNSRLAFLEAKRNGYDYCVLLNERQSVAEGPGACIFIVRNDVLITPPLYASILESINRKSFLEIAMNSIGMRCEEREIDRTELYLADEAFMAGTAIEIKSIGQIDHISLNNGKPGKYSTMLKDLYFAIVRNEMAEYNTWLSPVY